jgi:hypothetical protein
MNVIKRLLWKQSSSDENRCGLWRGTEPLKRPTSVTETLQVPVNLGIYPYISTLLPISASLPFTTATTKHSFGALKRMKSYLRSTMTENRLSEPTNLHINRDHKLCYKDVADEL